MDDQRAIRYRESVLPPGREEEPLVLAWAFEQAFAPFWQRRRLVRLWLFLGFALFTVTSAAGYAFQDRFISSADRAARENAFWLFAGLAVMAIICLIVLLYWTVRGPGNVPIGIAKGWWRLTAAPFSRGLLLYNTRRETDEQYVTFDVDGESSNERAPESTSAGYDGGVEEARFIRALLETRSKLHAIQLMPKPWRFAPSSSQFSAAICPILERLEPLREGQAPPQPVLPDLGGAHVTGAVALAHALETFTNKRKELTGLERDIHYILTQVQLAVERMEKGLSPLAKVTMRVRSSDGVLPPAVKESLVQAVQDLFAPVIERLNKEIELDVLMLEQKETDHIKELEAKHHHRVHVAEEERDAKIRRIRSERQTLREKLKDLEGKLQRARKPVDIPWKTSPPRRTIERPEFEGLQFKPENLFSDDSFGFEWEWPTDPSFSGQLSTKTETNVRVLESNLRSVKGKLSGMDTSIQDVRQRCQRLLEKYTVELERRIAHIRKAYQGKRADLRRHIQSVEQDQQELVAVIRQPAAKQPSRSTAVTEEWQTGEVEQTIVKFRRSALTSLAEAINKEWSNIRACHETTHYLIRRAVLPARTLPDAPGDYLVPVWFIKVANDPSWYPWLTVCDITEAPAGSHLAVHPILAEMRAMLDDLSTFDLDEILACRSILDDETKRQELLLQLGRLRGDGEISPKLFEAIERSFEDLA